MAAPLGREIWAVYERVQIQNSVLLLHAHTVIVLRKFQVLVQDKMLQPSPAEKAKM